MSDFLMPSLGADMEAGTLVAWLKSPGDRLAKGDAIAAVDTDKGVIDVEVFHAGVLEELLVPPGTRVPVGRPLARIREAGEPAAPPLRAADRGAGLQPAEPVPSSPPAASPAERMRRTIAAAMARSKREIPHYYLWTGIDLDRATRWLTGVNAERPIGRRLLPGVLFVKATALALEEFPEFSAVWEHDHLELRRPAHVGIAISLRTGGLVVLALHDTASRSLDDLMAGLADLTSRARTGRMRSSELADSTITVTSLGDRGVDAVLGVIHPPQVAVVGFGRIVERPWAAAGRPVMRPFVTASLAADHRASDGHRGGLFLAAIEQLLQEPDSL